MAHAEWFQSGGFYVALIGIVFTILLTIRVAIMSVRAAHSEIRSDREISAHQRGVLKSLSQGINHPLTATAAFPSDIEHLKTSFRNMSALVEKVQAGTVPGSMNGWASAVGRSLMGSTLHLDVVMVADWIDTYTKSLAAVKASEEQLAVSRGLGGKTLPVDRPLCYQKPRIFSTVRPTSQPLLGL